MYFIGCMQIFIVTAICFERCYILKNPFEIRKLDNKIMVKIICAFFLLSLLGDRTFSRLVLLLACLLLADSLTGCCVEYKSRETSVFSYNIAMFLFVFVVPFSFILISNIKLFLIVSIFYYII